MDVSNHAQKNRPEPDGQELIETVVSLTGLPQPLMEQELGEILEGAGISSNTCTLEQLRSAMLAYLESIQEAVQASCVETTESGSSGNLTPAE
ncbi:MAG: hypothetical protein NDJ89_00525 [Oligoflexia bacterium]|nr:hypothetical protein [Oligoflexia bacterium]